MANKRFCRRSSRNSARAPRATSASGASVLARAIDVMMPDRREDLPSRGMLRAMKKTAAKKKAKAAPKKTAKKVAKKAMAPRADLGAPIDGFFAKQPAKQRAILDALRAIIEENAPDAQSAIKWGNPFYSINGVMTCAMSSHKAHVNLMLAGPAGTFTDPDGLLEGEGKTGKHISFHDAKEIPKAKVRGWVREAADLARKKS